MRVEFRTIAIPAAAALVVAGALATPALFPEAFANEPQHQLVRQARDMFPPPFDPSKLKKFDIQLADTVSTEPLSTQYVRKIAYGRPTTVTITTTSSGTYSSDAITSPYVRYPGIDVVPKYRWPSFRAAMNISPAGRFTWSVISNGSFTYYTSDFVPTTR